MILRFPRCMPDSWSSRAMAISSTTVFTKKGRQHKGRGVTYVLSVEMRM